jgi:hypothetical protein
MHVLIIVWAVMLWMYGVAWVIQKNVDASQGFWANLVLDIMAAIALTACSGCIIGNELLPDGVTQNVGSLTWTVRLAGPGLALVTAGMAVLMIVMASLKFIASDERKKHKIGWVVSFGRSKFVSDYVYTTYPFGRLIFWLGLSLFEDGFQLEDDEVPDAFGKSKAVYRIVAKATSAVNRRQWLTLFEASKAEFRKRLVAAQSLPHKQWAAAIKDLKNFDPETDIIFEVQKLTFVAAWTEEGTEQNKLGALYILHKLELFGDREIVGYPNVFLLNGWAWVQMHSEPPAISIEELEQLGDDVPVPYTETDRPSSAVPVGEFRRIRPLEVDG